MTWSICIFAHNEETQLARCLAALDSAAVGAKIKIHVIENGSSDETARAARAIAAVDDRVQVHELALADKADAWNNYVHRIAGDDELHVFMNASTVPAPASFRSLALALASSPKAYAAAALPMSGPSRRAWATRLFTEHYLSSDLYAMRGDAIRFFRERRLRLPVGLVSVDGLLSYLLLTDLQGGPDDSHRHRITVAGGAFFDGDVLEIRLNDMRRYARRLRRCSERYFQGEILYARLKQNGVAAMPDRIDEVYTVDTVAPLVPRRSMRDYWFDLAVLGDLRKRAFAELL